MNVFGLFFTFASIMMTLLDVFGRKRSMILANVPFTIAWITLCGAEDVYELFIANILLGLGSGLMESPVVAYVGEIWYNFRLFAFILYLVIC